MNIKQDWFQGRYGVLNKSKFDIVETNLITPLMIEVPFMLMLLTLGYFSNISILMNGIIIFIVVMLVLTVIQFKNDYIKEISEPT